MSSPPGPGRRRHQPVLGRPGALLAAAGALLAACSSSTPGTLSRAPTAAPSGSTATGAPSATPAATPAAAPVCPAPLALGALPALARIAGDPDDIAVTPGGAVWLSLTQAGRLLELDAAGAVVADVADPNLPEGIVPLPDGRLAVAEQRSDRVDLFDPATRRFSTLLQLSPVPGSDGVDGLGVDGADLLVPDSARGTLLRVNLAGATSPLGADLGRPVAAAPLGDGSLLVTAENPPGLWRLAPGGRAAAVATSVALGSLDDIVVSGGLAYVTDLTGQRLLAVDPASGAVHVLVSGTPMPQGLARLADGRLLLADSTRRLVAVVAPCR